MVSSTKKISSTLLPSCFHIKNKILNKVANNLLNHISKIALILEFAKKKLLKFISNGKNNKTTYLVWKFTSS